MSATLLALDDVVLVRGGRRLADGLSFQVAAGDALVIAGPNGAGKSSLLRLCAGLLPPAGGTLRCPVGRAFLGEAAALDDERPLADALGFWAGLDGARGRLSDAMAALDLHALGEVPVRMLSTGQRRRAALARVAASGAPLWLLDEPVNGLDAASIAAVERLIARHRRTGGGVVVATHLALALPDAARLELSAA